MTIFLKKFQNVTRLGEKAQEIARAEKARHVEGGFEAIFGTYVEICGGYAHGNFCRVTVQTFELQELTSYPHIPGRQIHEWHIR